MSLAIQHLKIVESPIGKLSLIASGKGLSGLYFAASPAQKYIAQMLQDGSLVKEENNKLLIRTSAQLEDYFAGKRKAFDLPLDMQGTVFQINAWRQLQKIPYGQTLSYGEQAQRMGDAKKARAAGMANGRNPLGIVVPCHRVIGSNGLLTGFAGGTDSKKFLLELEQAHCA